MPGVFVGPGQKRARLRRALPELPLAAGAKVMCVGHSAENDYGFTGSNDNVNPPLTTIANRTTGEIPWMRGLDTRFNFDTWPDISAPYKDGTLNSRISGASQGLAGGQMAHLLAALPYFIAREPGIICLQYGYNDVALDGLNAAAIIANFDTAITMVTNAGIWIVVDEICAMDASRIPDGDPRLACIETVNAWINAQEGRPGVKPNKVSDTFGWPRPNQSYWLRDGLHKQDRGAYAAALRKFAILQTMVSPGDYRDHNPANGNVMPNATYTGTSGTKGAGVTGSVATNCDVSLSYVININYTSYDRLKAANIANAIADAYMVGELNARYQATKRASRWLQDRIAELRTQASEAEAAVQTFKSENNIVDTGRGLMSEQQLSDVNTQMVAARAATAEAKARLDRIDQISREDLPDATVTDALRNDVINRLRAQYLDISARASDWASRFGQTHIAVVNLRKQMLEIRKSMSDELRRIAETYRSDYEIAKVREQSLDSSLSSLVGQAATTGQAQIKLRDLESSAQTYRNMYDNFLQRFTEATQQQTFPINEARVITAATEPRQKSWPISTYVLAGSALIGLFFGVGGAFLLEYMDTMLRTPQQVEQLLGLDCLGIIPKISDATPAAAGGKGSTENPAAVLTSAGMMRYVVDAPFSRFAETLRSTKFASDFKNVDESSKVIGVISALPGEGKTTIASNLAELIAQSGAKVLLIDADMRNPSMTRLLMSGAKEGLLEVLTGRRRFQDVLWKEKQTGVDLLPTVLTGPIPHTSELISSKGMMALLKEARMHYEYIVLDLPPAAPVIDVRAVSSLIDGFLIVVEWGRTSRDTIQSSIVKNEEIKSRTLGVILNKANAASLKRIEDSTGQYYGSYYNS